MTRRLIFLSIILLAGASAFSQNIPTNPDSIPFALPVNYAVGSGPWSVFCADLNGDGYPDLAVANEGSDNVSVLK
ncbi:MAG TPA: VCBS repeat-containing protein, partial [candidate division Zixibacteria bacterium]